MQPSAKQMGLYRSGRARAVLEGENNHVAQAMSAFPFCQACAVLLSPPLRATHSSGSPQEGVP